MIGKLKVGKRLVIGFSVLMILMTVLTVISISRMALIQSNLKTITDYDAYVIRLLNSMRDATNVQSIAIRDVIMQEDFSFKKNELARMQAARKRYLETADVLVKTIIDDEGKSLLENIKTAEVVYQTNIDKAINHSLSEEINEASALARGALRDSQLALIVKLDALLERLQEHSDETVAHTGSVYDSARVTTITLLVIAILIAIITAFFISRSITSPLSKAVEIAQTIADGDLTSKFDVATDSEDEVGKLLQAMAKMHKNLQEVIRKVTGSTVELASATEEMSRIMSETTDNVSRQRIETDDVATAMNEMTATVQEVARNASHAADSAAQADKEAQASKHIVDQTVNSINELAIAIREVASATSKLTDETNNIGGVLDVIKGIAEQTNLLALNAAIEAARAGEQGRGFAVVADEVRTLASRTQNSTQEIQSMIQRLQLGAKDTVRAMEQGLNLVETTVSASAQAESSLKTILKSAKIILDMNTQIATAAEEQSQVSEGINRSVTNIASVAEQTVNGAQQTAAASATLAKLAIDVQNLLSQFRI